MQNGLLCLVGKGDMVKGERGNRSCLYRWEHIPGQGRGAWFVRALWQVERFSDPLCCCEASLHGIAQPAQTEQWRVELPQVGEEDHQSTDSQCTRSQRLRPEVDDKHRSNC